MEEGHQKNKEKRVFIILVGTLVILLVLLLTLLNRKQKLDQESLEQAQQTTDNLPGPQAPLTSPLPRTAFAGYTLNTELPTLPASVKLSDVKSSYTTGEALDLATKLGFKNAIVDDGVNVVLVTDQTAGEEAMLSINKTTGAMLFASENGVASGVGGADPTSAARSFLTKMGLLDSTMISTATYKRASFPDVTFVEFHRSWEKMGLPILNPLGALNLDETESLSNVKLGYLEANSPEDPDITESSDGYAGKVRPNDFNTITVAVFDQSNNIISVTSNIKILAKTQQKSSGETLKTPEEAFADLQSGKATFSLVKPTGEGAVDVSTVFPGSQAVSDNAVITDIVLTYIEEIGQKTQNTLYPYYLFRGTATLASGYQVQFVETVPAVKQINALGVFAQNTPPTVFPGQGSTLQYGTFNWLTPSPNTVACAGLTNIFQLPNGGYIGWYPNTKPRNWYYVPPPGEVVDAAKIKEVKSELREVAMSACRASLDDPSVCAIDPSLNLQTACYYATTGSPYIYVYTSSAKKVKVGVSQATTYADPVFSQENLWSFTALPDQTLSFASGLTRQKLYYEYDKSVFKSAASSLKKSSRGFVVNKAKLTEFVNSVSERLGLNSEEKQDLLTELTREANKLSAKALKVGLVDRQTLDNVLPVSVSPQPSNYHRVFFTVSSALGSEKLETPSLETLNRDDYTVVELGVLGL